MRPRWFGGASALALSVSMVGACQEPSLVAVSLEPPPHDDCLARGDGPSAFRHSCIGFSLQSEVDVVFIIDDTASMGVVQARLARAMDAMIESVALDNRDVDLRIGFVSVNSGDHACGGGSDGFARITSCRERPEDFVTPDGIDVFDELCADVCPLDELAVEPTSLWAGEEAEVRPWLEIVPGFDNLPDGVDLVDALRCVAPRGVSGCGYPELLETVDHTVVRAQHEDYDGFGFFRRGAGTVLVLVTDAVDCSLAPQGQVLLDPDGFRTFWSDREADSATPAVCWNAGVRCSPEDGPTYEDCRSAHFNVLGQEVAPGEGLMTAVSEHFERLGHHIAQMQRIRPDVEPLVLTIAGVPETGELVYADAEDPAFGLEYGIGPGCESPGVSARPPVRLREFTEGITGGELMSVCAEDLSPAMQRVAEAIGEQIVPACMPTCISDSEPDVDGMQVDCRVSREAPNAEGAFETSVVARCEGEDGAPVIPADEELCWYPKTGSAMSPQCRDFGWNLEFGILQAGRRRQYEYFRPTCTLSEDWERDCPDLP